MHVATVACTELLEGFDDQLTECPLRVGLIAFL